MCAVIPMFLILAMLVTRMTPSAFESLNTIDQPNLNLPFLARYPNIVKQVEAQRSARAMTTPRSP
jgi:hypothetical protein